VHLARVSNPATRTAREGLRHAAGKRITAETLETLQLALLSSHRELDAISFREGHQRLRPRDRGEAHFGDAAEKAEVMGGNRGEDVNRQCRGREKNTVLIATLGVETGLQEVYSTIKTKLDRQRRSGNIAGM